MVITLLGEFGEVRLRGDVADINEFRRWADSDEFPEKARAWWLCGELWLDVGREQIFSHALAAGEIGSVLSRLVKAERLGSVWMRGPFFSNFEADISGNPDMTFASYDTLQSDRVRLLEGKEGGFIELQGSPDMVLEVLSRSSVQKDTVILRDAYWKAGIREYWIVDARNAPPKFDILKYGPRGYAAVRKQDGWMKSPVFGKSFRFTQTTGPAGHPDYTLEVR